MLSCSLSPLPSFFLFFSLFLYPLSPLPASTVHKHLQEKDLQEIVQLVGRDSLSEDQKVILEIAKIIREDYLQQNAFSEHDFNCPIEKAVGMLRSIVTLFNRCLKAVTGSSDGTTKASADAKTLTWNAIRTAAGDVIYRTTQMKFLDPRTSAEGTNAFFATLIDDINNKFDELAE